MQTTTATTDRGTTATGAFEVIAEFGDYRQAQRLVDRLSDAKFPVQTVRVVGSGIRTVENVTGRLTKGRAALYGAFSGAWFGLLIGVLMGLFTVGPAWFALLGSAITLGVLWGAVLGFLVHWASRGTRDFTSVTRLAAERYEVQVASPLADEARGAAALA